jgi:hypothetical protein
MWQFLFEARRLSNIRSHEKLNAHIWLRINDLDSVKLFLTPSSTSELREI